MAKEQKRERGGGRERMPSRSIWPSVWIAAAVAVVVVPFGYAITGVHEDVWVGAGCGLALGVGVGLRGGTGAGPWMGIVIGSIVGIAAALIAGLVPGDAVGILAPPILGLAAGLIDGLRGSSLSGYRDMCREAFIVSALLAAGFLPLVDSSSDLPITLAPLICMPWVALTAGLLSHRRRGWRDTRPPRLLLAAAGVLFVLLILLAVDEAMALGNLRPGVVSVMQFAGFVALALVAIAGISFLVGRTAITWLQPRLRVYGHLTDYLRVMWVPIGGFAVGYLTIIVVFAGFYGMFERFNPGAFGGVGEATGIADWLSFAFFNALAQDYVALAPASVGARVLVGAHLILSVGWALVLFAAVMTSIGPKLDRIARRGGEDGDE